MILLGWVIVCGQNTRLRGNVKKANTGIVQTMTDRTLMPEWYGAKGDGKTDAREKGSSEYTGDGGRQRKKEKNTGGKVIVKGRQSFDVKI